MAKHKWHDEIVAWASGAEIEVKFYDNQLNESEWIDVELDHDWSVIDVEYRIKPQPKEPQYLYVLREQGKSDYWLSPFSASANNVKTIGKIKLEDE